MQRDIAAGMAVRQAYNAMRQRLRAEDFRRQGQHRRALERQQADRDWHEEHDVHLHEDDFVRVDPLEGEVETELVAEVDDDAGDQRLRVGKQRKKSEPEVQ
eukprot:4785052-Alexandrium_andersonii.AAC.1